MDGMLYHWNHIENTGGVGTASEHIEIPPHSTIAQSYLSGNFDKTDPNLAETLFSTCEFIDDAGVQRMRELSVPAFSQKNLVRVDLISVVDSGAYDYIVNLFFWPEVS